MDTCEKKYPVGQRLTAENLACRRGGRLVFEGLAFDVGPGDLLHLKGANGTGKTTLLRLLAGFLTAKAGDISYAGEVLDAADISESGAFIYAGHQHGLKPVLTLRENAEAYYQLMKGVKVSEKKIQAAAEIFGLTALIDHPLRFFSSGQTHRCALLRLALLERPVWLLDEPTVGLDAINRDRLHSVMETHLGRGGIIVVASHDPLDLEGATLEMNSFAPKKREEDMWL